MTTFRIHEDLDKIPLYSRNNCMHNVINEKQKVKSKTYSQIIVDENILKKRSFFNNKGISHAIKNKKVGIKTLGDSSTVNQDKEEEIDNAVEIKEPLFFPVEKENKLASFTQEKIDISIDLLHNIEYKQEIWTYLRELEVKLSLPKPIYMTKQNEINWDSRSILVDWLASVSEEYKFNDETFHLGVNYIDRFLSHICVARNKFQLVGAAAMMIASKMEEYYAVDAREWSYLTGDTFTTRQVLKMEQIIMKVLKFRLQPPTINGFIQHLATEDKMDAKTLHLAMYIGELVLLEGNDYLEYFPSKLASACIALARFTLWKRTTWPKKLKKVSGYSLKELSPVVQRQNKTLRDSPLKKQQAIQTKYKTDKFNMVSLTKPRKLLIHDFNLEN